MKELNELSMTNNLKLEVGLLVTTFADMEDLLESKDYPLGYERVAWNKYTYFKPYSKELDDFRWGIPYIKQVMELDCKRIEKKGKEYNARLVLMVSNTTDTVLTIQEISLE
jgi:hypothetical protein